MQEAKCCNSTHMTTLSKVTNKVGKEEEIEENTRKKDAPLPKCLSPDPISKVIHFRNVTKELTRADVLGLATPFGAVNKIVLMRTMNQCLLEFKEIRPAILLINFYVNAPPQIRGRKIYARFSRQQILTTPNSSSNRILLVTLQTNLQPIVADVIWQIFSPYGFVEKIVVINKNAGLQALIQTQQRFQQQFFST
eukprot:TRINITY_DN17956_c0_g1_i1.p1 TRINITY_DN17956_c0_g1~~TRINITY_DN17956_c0_g1_i1.p1  ORF type:complete len:194 (-),score=21.38 TRINITY_DN17956_c0_g1_i1:235-816(-)